MKACFKALLSLALLLLLTAGAANAASIQEAKFLPDTNSVSLSGKVVTYTSTDFFYIGEDSRCMGIRVEKAGHGLSVGMRADVSGEMATKIDSKERYILATDAVQSAAPNGTGSVLPIIMNQKSVGGAGWSVSGTGGQRGITGSYGLNNIGLLVKTFGQFQKIDETTFTVSDGFTSLRCTVPSGTFLSATWQSVAVTGISSMYSTGTSYLPVLLVTDIDILRPTEVVTMPGQPSGETGPLTNLSYGYSTTGSTCSQGHPVEYRFSWGDGTYSDWSTSKTAVHTWTTTGSKIVTVTARCQTSPAVSSTSVGRTVTPVTQLASSPWPMFRHDATRSGVSPFHDSIPSGDVWSQSIGNGLSSPAIGPDGTIYLAGNDTTIPSAPVPYFYALNRDGSVKWRSPINLSTRCSPAIGSVSGNLMIYIGGSSVLYAFDSVGNQKWAYTVNGEISGSPAVAPNGTIYVATKGGTLYSLTPGLTSVTQNWADSVGAMHMTSPCVSTDGKTVYAAGGTSAYAINATTGGYNWTYSFGTATTSSVALSPDGAALYVGSGNNYLYSFSTASTNTSVIVNWYTQIDFTQSVTSASPAVGPDGTIYLASNYGTLYAFNPTDGSQKWTFDTGASDIRASAALNADGTLVLASYDGYVRGLNSATGAEKWHYLLPGSLFASPAIAANGTIVIANMGGTVFGNIGGVRPAPVAPSNLTITLTSDTSVNLAWTDNSSDEYGFRIEKRRGTTGAWTIMPRIGGGFPTVSTPTTTYSDSGLQTGQDYYYRVCAYGPGGDSLYSNEAPVTTLGIETPADLTAIPVSSTQVDLAWTDRTPAELGFKIERMLGPNGLFEEIGQVGPGVTYYSDVTAYPGFNYYYRVKSYDATRVSSGSDEAWALTPGGSLAPITTGNTTRKQMALTFDAGFPPIRPNISTNLKNAFAYSTFFITGQATEYDSGNIAKLANDGMHICNHTYTHPNLRYCTDEDIARQFNETDDIIYATTKTDTSNPNHTRSFFRAPYGAVNDHVHDAAAADGFRSVYWTGDSRDVAGATAGQIRTNVNNAARNGAIILFHCTMSTTDSAVPNVITDLKNAGYDLVTVPELIAPTQVTSPAGHIGTGWNLISVPIDPALGFPQIIFRGLTINTNLKRWSRGTVTSPGVEQVYSSSNPKPFGNINADDAYWFYSSSSSTTLKINGAAATTDRRIRLQYTAAPVTHSTYGLIGYPFQTAQSFSNCQVYNPSAEEPKTRPVAEAMTLGWITTFYGWNPTTQTEYAVTAGSLLEPWHGYRGACLVPGCELIIPHL